MLLDNVNATVEYIRTKTSFNPKAAVILGSGLGAFAEEIEDAIIIPYEEIPGFVVSTAPGHNGRLVIGKMAGKEILCMQGRFHYFEGYSMKSVVYPIRVMKMLGIEKLIVTNSCGGIDLSFKPGDLMVIEDHINLLGNNPLIGPNEEEFGVRFTDMTEAYSKKLRNVIEKSAEEISLELKKGVYCAYSGPTYETPAEIRMMRIMGANAVGMSTVPEVITANHCGIQVAAISCITNMAAGILPQPLTSDEVIETADRVKETFISLLKQVVKNLEM